MNLILIFIFSFISIIFSIVLKNKFVNLTKYLIIIVSSILFFLIVFEIFPNIFIYYNVYIIVLFILLGVLFCEYLDILINKSNNPFNDNKNIIYKEILFALSQGLLIKVFLDIEFYLGIKLLIIFTIYNILKSILNNNDLYKNIFNNIFLIIGSILGIFVINDFCLFALTAVLGGLNLYAISEDMTFFLEYSINEKLKGILFCAIGFIFGFTLMLI